MTSTADKHQNCDPCKFPPDSFNCVVKYVVYKFIGKTCHMDVWIQKSVTCHRFYIGETFTLRETRISIKSEDFKSAFSQHLIEHKHEDLSLSNFDLEIGFKCKSPVETRMAEAREISVH